MLSRVYLRHTPLGYAKLRVHTSLNHFSPFIAVLATFPQDHEVPTQYSSREYLNMSTLCSTSC
jgi:hypothetical protein